MKNSVPALRSLSCALKKATRQCQNRLPLLNTVFCQTFIKCLSIFSKAEWELPKLSLLTDEWSFLSENLDKPISPKEETFPIIKIYHTSGSWPAQPRRRKRHKLLLSSPIKGRLRLFCLHNSYPTELYPVQNQSYFLDAGQ